jgi:hypothetical protein
MLRADPAGACETPAANRFENRKQTKPNQQQTDPKFEIGHDNTGDQQNRSDHTAHHSAMKSNITSKKPTHDSVLAQNNPDIQTLLSVPDKKCSPHEKCPSGSTLDSGQLAT